MRNTESLELLPFGMTFTVFVTSSVHALESLLRITIEFRLSLSSNQTDHIYNSLRRGNFQNDDLLNIDNPYFEGMVNQIYPPELQLNKANPSDTEAPFLDLHLSISNGFVSSKIYDKRYDFDFDSPF